MAKLTTIKGPAIFVAQYVSDESPFNSLDGIAGWAAGLGFKAIQIPIDDRLIDIERAASDQSYCDSLLGILRGHGIQLTILLMTFFSTVLLLSLFGEISKHAQSGPVRCYCWRRKPQRT
jgi:sugar phosphate isomerase/epimerase